MAVNSTNYTKNTFNSTKYGTPSSSGDILLLQASSDEFLLQDGFARLLLEEGETVQTNYTFTTKN